MKNNQRTKKMFLLLSLFLLAVGERTLFDLGPNFELVTTAMILASFYFGRKESFWLTFAIIAISDRLIGNSSIFLFTWTGFLIPALFSNKFIQKFLNLKSIILNRKSKLFKKVFTISTLAATGLFANTFFFLWTNFGVWFLDSFNMYPDTLRGLIMSYINGLPFLKYQVTGSLLFIPLGFISTEFAIYIKNYFQERVRVEGSPV